MGAGVASLSPAPGRGIAVKDKHWIRLLWTILVIEIGCIGAHIYWLATTPHGRTWVTFVFFIISAGRTIQYINKYNAEKRNVE